MSCSAALLGTRGTAIDQRLGDALFGQMPHTPRTNVPPEKKIKQPINGDYCKEAEIWLHVSPPPPPILGSARHTP